MAGHSSFTDLKLHLCKSSFNMLLGIVVPLGFVLFVLAFFGFGNPVIESLTS